MRGSARFGARNSPAAHGVRGRGAVAGSSHTRGRCRAGVRLCRGFRKRPLPVSDAVVGRPDGAGRRDRAIRSDGRVIAGVGPGSSERDYDAVGVSYEERWERFDEAAAILRALLRGDPPPDDCRHYSLPDAPLAPAPRRTGGVPLWIGSWGSKAGLRRVARLGDGWLASAYNTTPKGFNAAKESLSEELRARGRDPDRFPSALVTMWTWITDDARDAERVLREVLAPVLRRDADALRGQVCIGSAEKCAELLSRYARAGCDRVHLWPLGDEPRQLELVAAEVATRIER